ncbi:MAG: Uma2 family endonuclease [Gemmatimonadales bacterium]
MPIVKRQWTFDDLEELPDDGNRYEIIDGELFVTPLPVWPHQQAIAELYKLVDAYLRHVSVGFAYFAPADVVFSPRRAVQPDLLVVPPVDGRRPTSFAAVGRLLLAIEVLSRARRAPIASLNARCSAKKASLSIGSSISTRTPSSGRHRLKRAPRFSTSGSTGRPTVPRSRSRSTCPRISPACSTSSRSNARPRPGPSTASPDRR